MHVRSWMCVASTFTQQYTELKERGELWFYFLLSHGWQRRRGQVGGGSKRGATNRLVAALCLAHPHACSDFILYPRSLLSLLARSLLSVFMVSLCCFGYSLVQCARFALLFFAVIPEPFLAPSAQELRPGKGTRSRQTNQKDPERVTGRRMNVV